MTNGSVLLNILILSALTALLCHGFCKLYMYIVYCVKFRIFLHICEIIIGGVLLFYTIHCLPTILTAKFAILLWSIFLFGTGLYEMISLRKSDIKKIMSRPIFKMVLGTAFLVVDILIADANIGVILRVCFVSVCFMVGYRLSNEAKGEKIL